VKCDTDLIRYVDSKNLWYLVLLYYNKVNMKNTQSIHNNNKQTSKINNPKTRTHNKPVKSTIRKKKEKKKEKNPENKPSGGLDEKGNPFPIENPEGGDPICPGGYKIDYDFDPFNDPINPLFRCISALKEPSEEPKESSIMDKLNNPASNITDLALKASAPAAGGGRTIRMRQTRKDAHGKRRGRGRRRGSRNIITQRSKK
jgi:hypothetical protein